MIYKDKALIPDKYWKLVNSGRWYWITKTGFNSQTLYVGVCRKSNGQERYF